MAADFETDLDCSKKYFAQIKSAVEKTLNWRIYNVEGVDNSLSEFLDQKCGVDYMIVAGGDVHGGLAVRMQDVKKNKKSYNSFTVRKTRDNGSKCEWAKILLDEYKADNFLQAYILPDKVIVGVCKTVDLREYILNHKPPSKENPEDKNTFFIIYWTDFQRAGFNMRLFEVHKKISN